LRHEITPGQELNREGDVGGFGVGSEFSWQVVGTHGFDTICLRTPLHADIALLRWILVRPVRMERTAPQRSAWLRAELEREKGGSGLR
jgi:hypothetical protein